MKTEEKYKKILLAITESAMLGKTEKVKAILTELSNWRFHLINNTEGQTSIEHEKELDSALNNVLQTIYNKRL